MTDLRKLEPRALVSLKLSRCWDQLLLQYQRYIAREGNHPTIFILSSLFTTFSSSTMIAQPPPCLSVPLFFRISFRLFHLLSDLLQAASHKIVLLRVAWLGKLCIIDMFYGDDEREESAEENIGRWMAIKYAWRFVFVFSRSMFLFPASAKNCLALLFESRADSTSLKSNLRHVRDDKV